MFCFCLYLPTPTPIRARLANNPHGFTQPAFSEDSTAEHFHPRQARTWEQNQLGNGRRERTGGGRLSAKHMDSGQFVPEQVNFSYDYARPTINGTTHANRGQSRTGTYNYALTYITDGTRTSVQLCHKKQYCTNRSLRPYKSHNKQYRTNRSLRPYKRLCRFACNDTNNNQ